MKPWAERFYNSDAWRDCRDAFLQSKGYLCERCLPEALVIAKIVHHKIYLTRNNINDPMVALSWENLEALCQDCHNKEHHGSRKKRYVFDSNGNILPSSPLLAKKFMGNEHREGLIKKTLQKFL